MLLSFFQLRNTKNSQIAPQTGGPGPIVIEDKHHEEGKNHDGPDHLGIGPDQKLNSGQRVGCAGVVLVRARFGAEEGAGFGRFGRGGAAHGGGSIARRDGEGVRRAVGRGGVHDYLCVVVVVVVSAGCAADVVGGIAGQCLSSRSVCAVRNRAGQPTGDSYASSALR